MKIRKITVLTLTVAVLAGIIGTAGMAQTDRRSANIKSKGIIDFENGTTIIDASDFIYLADEIDLLEDTYKTETVNALNQIGTFYNLDGTTTFNKDESTLSAANAAILPFSAITNGIIHSQSIPTERTYSGTLPGETIETSGNIAAATAANLSLGTAAWVDGELIVGTGADNNSYYTQGWADGFNKLMNGISINYKYHQHSDGNGNISTNTVIYSLVNPGGCYKANGHTHNKTGTCSYYDNPVVYCGTACGWTNHDDSGIHNTWQCSNGHNRPESESVCQQVISGGDRVYTCGRLINTYILGCGKTENTIESATIIFE